MPEPLSDDQLARLRELTEQATPGPWGWHGHDDGQVELCTLHSGYRRVIAAQRSEPCIVELGDGSMALTIEACVRCMGAFAEPEVEHLDRCEKPENLGTVWLWDKGFISPANQWAVREQPYRSDVKAVEHPDAEFIAAAREAVPALLAKVDRLRADLEAAEETIKAQKADMGTWAVRWQEQFDRAERAEAAVPGPSQPTDCPSDAAADLRGPGETPHSVCPHVQTSEEGTSYCTLAAAPGEQLAEAREDAERWRRTTELLIDNVRRVAHEMDGSGNYPATGWSYELTVAADQAEGKS